MPFWRPTTDEPKKTTTRTWTYGCRRPTFGREAALAVMRERTRLWNALVEVDHWGWQRIEELRRPFLPPEPPPLPKLARGTPVPPEVAELRRQWKDYRAQQKRVFSEHPELVESLRALDAEVYEKAKAVKNSFEDLWWHNRDTVFADFLKARRKRRPLRFHAEARGTVTVTWSHGRPVDRLWTGATPRATDGLTIPLPPAFVFDQTTPRTLRDKARWVYAQFLLDAESVLILPVALDRPLPEGAVLRLAHLSRETIGPDERWDLHIVAEQPLPVPTERHGCVAVDIGWRFLPGVLPTEGTPARRRLDRICTRIPTDDLVLGALRMATWRDDQGRTGELILDADWMLRMDRCHHLQKDRDLLFDRIRARLVETASAHPEQTWLRERISGIDRWRDKRKAVQLIRDWQSFAGDEQVRAELAAWEAKDRHLWRWERSMADKLLRARREQYRLFAKNLAMQYGQVVIEHFDLTTMAMPERRIPRRWMEEGQREAGRDWKDWVRQDLQEHPERYDLTGLPPDETVRFFLEDPGQRRHRVRAATYLLRQAIVNAVEREGGTVTIVPAANTTAWCPTCQAPGQWADPAALVQRCEGCGTVYDQDVRAAENLLAVIGAANGWGS